MPSHGHVDAIRVFVADSTLMGNELLAAALSRERRFCVTGTAERGEKLLEEIGNIQIHQPIDAAIISANFGGPSAGARLARRVLALHPGIRLVMLLECSERTAVVEAFGAGATGIFCRAEPVDVLWNCIESVCRGKVWATDEELKYVLEELGSLPTSRISSRSEKCSLAVREQKIIRLVAEGLTNREIAAELGLNEHTLKSCLQSIFNKLNVSSRAEMVFAALAYCGRETAAPEARDREEQHNAGPSGPPDQFERYRQDAERSLPGAQMTIGEMCMQGQGTERDLVAAYCWFVVAQESAKQIIQVSAAYQKSLAARMSREQVAEAERSACEWLKQHELRAGMPLSGNKSGKATPSHPLNHRPALSA